MLALPISYALLCLVINNKSNRLNLTKLPGQALDLFKYIPFLFIALLFVPNNDTLALPNYVMAFIPLSIAGAILLVNYIMREMLSGTKELITTANNFGATPGQIIKFILLPHKAYDLIHHLSKTIIHLATFSTIAGAMGYGGLGQIAAYRALENFNLNYILACALAMLVFIKAVAYTFDLVSHTLQRR